MYSLRYFGEEKDSLQLHRVESQPKTLEIQKRVCDIICKHQDASCIRERSDLLRYINLSNNIIYVA